jgi:Ca2+/Na+ antiporter
LISTFVIIIIISVLRIRRSIQGTKVNVKKTIIFSAYFVAITSFLVYNSFLIGSVAVLYVIPYFAVVIVTIYYSYIYSKTDRPDRAPEKLTVDGEAEKVYECNIKTQAQSGTNNQDGQQTDASSAATSGRVSNTNTETRTPEQQAEIVVTPTQLMKISDIKIEKRFRKDPTIIDDLVESIRKKDDQLYPILVRKKDNTLVDGAFYYSLLTKQGLIKD